MANIFGLSGISLSLLNQLGGVKINNVGTKFQEDLKVLLETKKGSLIGDPGFGCDVIDLLYEPANEGTAAMMRIEIAKAIEKYYPNISITQVDISFKSHTVQLLIYYKIYRSNIEDTVMLEFIRPSI